MTYRRQMRRSTLRDGEREQKKEEQGKQQQSFLCISQNIHSDDNGIRVILCDGRIQFVVLDAFD